MPARPRIAIVASHPIQHFCPFYRALSSDGRLKVKVLFGSSAGSRPYFDKQFNQTIQWQSNLLAGYDHEFLPGADRNELGGLERNSNLGARLAAFDPDVVQVYGFAQRISRSAIYWARKRGKRVFQVADSNLIGERSLATRLRKRLTVPLLLSQMDAILTIGDSNEAYYKHYGASNSKLHRCPLTIDEDRLRLDARERAESRRQIRLLHQIPEDAVVAAVVGKLLKAKAVEDAIEAVSLLWRTGFENRIFLLILGDGPHRDGLVEAAAKQASEAIKFAGFQNADALPGHYFAADLLIHPSSLDAHPLAITEAIFCGLPVIASDRVGSTGPTDDLQIGRNGLQYPFGNTGLLAEYIRKLITDPIVRSEMGNGSLEIADGRRIGASVEAFVGAVAMKGQ